MRSHKQGQESKGQGPKDGEARGKKLGDQGRVGGMRDGTWGQLH